jgi:uncharacterized protein YkuJ
MNRIQEQQLKKAQEYASRWNGDCLSTEYKNNQTKLLWHCRNPNHYPFQATYNYLSVKKRWCPECLDRPSPEEQLQKAKGYANSRGGICLSEEYINSKSYLKWKCFYLEHDTFETTYDNAVSHNKWCPECAGFFSPEKLIYKAKQYAISRGGECISDACLDKTSALLWDCKKPGHNPWKAKYNIVDKNNWCYDCGIEAISKKNTLSNGLDLAKKLASDKGGICLSTEYINNSIKMLWKCFYLHHNTWESQYSNVRNGKWCPECSGLLSSPEAYLEKAKEKARSRDGECLSNEYENNQTKMLWKCSHKSHPIWSASYANVVNHDRWCPKCSDFLYYKEGKIRNLLSYLLNTEFEKIKPEWNINPKTGLCLELDGYSKDLELAFEFQGRHHYEKAFGRDDDDVEYIKYKDEVKKQNCKNNNVKLIIIDDIKGTDNNDGLLNHVLNVLQLEKVTLLKPINDEEVTKVLNKMSDFQEDALKKARDYAVSRKGKCLSTSYINKESKLEWKCDNDNHKSWFRNMDLVYNKSWCRRCVAKERASKNKTK